MAEIRSVETQQAVEKGSPALLRSIASLQRIGKYASARRFLARLASEAFLNSLNLSFSTLCQEMRNEIDDSRMHSFVLCPNLNHQSTTSTTRGKKIATRMFLRDFPRQSLCERDKGNYLSTTRPPVTLRVSATFSQLSQSRSSMASAP